LPHTSKNSAQKASSTLASEAKGEVSHFGSAYVHESAVIDEGAELGEGVKVWHFCHVMKNARLGTGTSLGQNAFVASGVTTGSNCKIQNNVSLYQGVTLGDDVFLGPSCVFTNVINPRSAIVRTSSYLSTHVGRGVTVGANATIVCGNDIGDYAFIGAGSVVTKSVAPYALVVGNPARQIGWMSTHGHRLEFATDGLATCPESGKVYRLSAEGVQLLA
jgi:UDP-2-acetamido-3-amino-2,3-dideoxy-glucuronate N-acetyltransferase